MVSEEQLLKDLKDFANEIGRTPTRRGMDRSGPWSSSTYQKYFDSWNNALKEAELTLNKEHSSSEGQLLEDLKGFADEIGKTPLATEMKKNGPRSVSTYRKHFGSWNNALDKAGIEINRSFRSRVSDEKLLEELKDFADEIGETPTMDQMRKDGPRSDRTYRNNFGSWNNALHQAGLTVNKVYNIRTEWGGSVNNSFGKSYTKMRVKVKKRDDERCRVCSSEEYLHVHHIKPRRLFENVDNSNTLDNLITLCNSCHPRFENKWFECDPDQFAERAKASLNK